MKRATIILSLLLTTTAAAREPVPLWISFTEAELQRAKRTALHMMNSPEVWAQFPQRPHQAHYIALLRQIGFGFSQERGLNTVTVFIPTTHVGLRHRADVCVKFDQGLKITDIAESPEI